MRFLCLGLLILVVSGCASNPVYDPLRAAQSQVLLLNESALKAIHEGMTSQEVHGVMGDSIVIGYVSELKPSSDYKPLTLPNPYKVEEINTPRGVYEVEYYVTSVREADGVISDNELIPLVFMGNVMVGHGWDFLNSLRSIKPTV